MIVRKSKPMLHPFMTKRGRMGGNSGKSCFYKWK